MITLTQLFGKKKFLAEHYENAKVFLPKVEALLTYATALGAYQPVNDPDTGTQISGSKGGSGDGGYRLPDAATGRPNSSHKEGRGVDVYDPGNHLDNWLTDEILAKFGLYREHPGYTGGWCHLTDRPPRYGNRTFRPY